MQLRARVHVSIVLFCCAVTVTSMQAQQTKKKLLSEEIRSVIDREGAEAARRRFEAIYPAQRDEYEIDMQGMAQLAMEYMQAGDQVAAGTVLNMSATITKDMIGSGTSMSGSANPAGTGAGRSPQSDPTPPPSTQAEDWGPARDDLDRFKGVYGVEGQDPRRDLFVTVSCDGYLVIGAMWGDASNWWMKSVGDLEFEMSDSFRSLRVEFDVAEGGAVRAMRHDLDGLLSPLPRAGALPEGWGRCVQRSGGG